MNMGFLDQQIERGGAVARRLGLPMDGALRWVEATAKPYALARVVENALGFVRRSGFKVRELERGRVVCEMPLRGNKNHIGTMYAGALYTLAEVPGGALFLSSFDTRNFVPIVTESRLKFLAPAKSAVTIEVALSGEEIESIQAEATRAGKACFTLEAELRAVSDGSLVAVSQMDYQLRAKRRAVPAQS